MTSPAPSPSLSRGSKAQLREAFRPGSDCSRDTGDRNGWHPAPSRRACEPRGLEIRMNDDRPFRFFDNREQYLLFVTTCSEKWAIGQRIGAELPVLSPQPPALRVWARTASRSKDRKNKASIAMVGSIGAVVGGFEIATRADESRSRWCDFAPANRKACREGAGERRAREARRNGAVAHRRARSRQGRSWGGRRPGLRGMERRCAAAVSTTPLNAARCVRRAAPPTELHAGQTDGLPDRHGRSCRLIRILLHRCRIRTQRIQDFR